MLPQENSENLGVNILNFGVMPLINLGRDS